MNPKDRAKLSSLIEKAMRTIQVADDQLDGQGSDADLEFVRECIKKSRDVCTEALMLLPNPNGT